MTLPNPPGRRDLDIAMRTCLTDLLDGLGNLGFAFEDEEVNGGDLVDELQRHKGAVRAAFNRADRAGDGNRDPHLYCAVSWAFSAFMEVGMYTRGAVNGADAVDRLGELYRDLTEQPVPLGLMAHAIYSPALARFFTGSKDPEDWGDLPGALLVHDPGGEKGQRLVAVARCAADDAAWISAAAAKELLQPVPPTDAMRG